MDNVKSKGKFRLLLACTAIARIAAIPVEASAQASSAHTNEESARLEHLQIRLADSLEINGLTNQERILLIKMLDKAKKAPRMEQAVDCETAE